MIDMKILVTGSSGFIGSNLVSLLRSKEIEVISVDNKEDASPGSDIRTIQWDLSSVDSVIHLAAKISVAESLRRKKNITKSMSRPQNVCSKRVEISE